MLRTAIKISPFTVKGISKPNGSPSGLTLTVDSDTQITAHWTNGATNQDGTKVYISTDAINYTLKGTVSGSSTSLAVTGLTAGTRYYFYVIHYKGNKEGIASSIVNAYTFDLDALAYIAAESISGRLQKNAINRLVIDFKAINSISANFINFGNISSSTLKAIYLFVCAGTYDKFNLVNPLDSDANFRLVNAATPTKSIKGANYGSNYTDSKLNTRSALSFTTNHICYFLALNEYFNGNTMDIGSYGGSTDAFRMSSGYGADCTALFHVGNAQITSPTNLTKNASGLFLGNKLGNAIGDASLHRNNKVLATNGSSISGTLPNLTANIGIANGLPTWQGLRTFGFASFGDGIPANCIQPYKNAIYRYLNSIYRLTSMNIVFEGHSFLAPASDSYTIVTEVNNYLNTNGYLEFDYSDGAVGGSTVAGMTSRASSSVTPYKVDIADISFQNVLVLWIGVNDIGSGATAYADMITYINSRIGEGWEVFLFTMTPSHYGSLPADFETQRNIFNNLIRANVPSMPHVHYYDTDTDSRFNDPENATYFKASDKLHPTAALGTIAGDAMGALIKSYYDSIKINHENFAISAQAGAVINQLSITFSANLNSGMTPDISAFGISGKTINAISISGAVVTLTTTTHFNAFDTPLVSYTQPESNKLVDTNGILISSFTSFPVVLDSSIIPSYSNTGGTGNRSALITVASTVSYLAGSGANFVDGLQTDSRFRFTGEAVSGKYIQFDFGTGNTKLITEAIYYAGSSTAQGTWRWQGSNDGSNWTNIGNTFTLGGTNTQYLTELNGNTNGYRYYRLLGVSGNDVNGVWLRQMTFKIANA